MRGRASLSVTLLKNRRQSPVDPSSVGCADTFSRKGRRNSDAPWAPNGRIARPPGVESTRASGGVRDNS
jgi:hypothetical protein